MASTDALPVPRKNVAYRVLFAIYDADGDLVTGAAGLDSEISKDQGTYADCTNEATEVATSSGTYYLDLTSTEMNCDGVMIIVKTSTVGAKTTFIVLYPQESGDIKVDVQSWLGTAVSTPTNAGVPNVNVKTWNDLATVALPLVPATAGRTLVVDAAGLADANAVKVGPTGSGTAQTAGDLKASITTVGNFVDTEISDIQVRLPAALTANGNMKSSLVEILTTALTETAGLLAGGFKKFFNIATPASTMDVIARVTLTDTVTTYTGNTPQTGDAYARIGAAGASLSAIPWNASWDAEVQSEVQDALDGTIADSIPADGTRPSISQALYMLTQFMLERSVASTTVTVKKTDGSSTLFTLTLNDATTPTSITRAT